MESLSVGGLASGLDTNAIIDGLTQIELAKVSRVEVKQKDVEVKLDAFNELYGKISEFATKAGTLDDVKSFNLFSSESSDEDFVTVDGTEDAIPGTFDVEVASLASNWKVASKSFGSPIEAFGFTGSFEISKTRSAIENDPTEPTVEVQVEATDTLKDIISKINAADGSGASASIISLGDNDFRLVLNSVDEGSEGFFLKDTGAANILDDGGLGIMDYSQTVSSDFNLKLNTVGAAETTTQFSELFSGIGDHTIDAGDEITITGKDADGNNVTGTFTIGAASTIQDLLDQTKTTFEAFGTTVDVSLNSSGEIIISDTSGGVSEMELNMSFNDVNASGSELLLSQAGATGNVINNYTNVLSTGQKAFYKVDGLSISSESNTNDSTITGTEFTLKQAELGKVIKLTLERDNDGIKEKIQDFLNSYNDVIGYLNYKSKVNIEESDDPNKKEEVRSKGPFAGDSQIMRIKSELRNLVTSSIEELNNRSPYSSLATIGILSSTTDGTLAIDEEDFNKALEEDFEGVRSLFISSGYSDNSSHELGRFTNDSVTGIYTIDADNDLIDGADAERNGSVLASSTGNTNGMILDAPAGSGTGELTFIRGIAGKISKYWDLASDKFEGYLTQTKDAIKNQIESYQDRMDILTEKADAYRTKLVRQFSDLEMAMSRLQQQSSSFQSQIGAF
ncbi:MAG: flagellar filament capping protein FliD [Fibrobacteria bacterium]|nr:flagellar filament capping protein FliD [Fibrobacteria bacterium]